MMAVYAALYATALVIAPCPLSHYDNKLISKNQLYSFAWFNSITICF